MSQLYLDRLFAWAESRQGSRLQEGAPAAPQPFKLGAYNMGDCVLKLWLSLNGAESDRHDGRFRLVLDLGDRVEDSVLDLLILAGLPVIRASRALHTVELPQFSQLCQQHAEARARSTGPDPAPRACSEHAEDGYARDCNHCYQGCPDCRLFRVTPDGFGYIGSFDPAGTYVGRPYEIIEVKSMSDFAFKRAEEGQLDSKYLAQCEVYLRAFPGARRVVLLAYRKETSHMCEVAIERDDKRWADIAAAFAVATGKERPPRPFVLTEMCPGCRGSGRTAVRQQPHKACNGTGKLPRPIIPRFPCGYCGVKTACWGPLDMVVDREGAPNWTPKGTT